MDIISTVASILLKKLGNYCEIFSDPSLSYTYIYFKLKF